MNKTLIQMWGQAGFHRRNISIFWVVYFSKNEKNTVPQKSKQGEPRLSTEPALEG